MAKCFAQEKDLSRLMQLMDEMSSKNIKPSIFVYNAILEYLDDQRAF